MRKDEQQHRPYPPAYLAAKELAFWLNCSERAVDSYARVNLLPRPVKIGNLVRWRWADIEAHIAAQNGEFAQPDGDGDEYATNIVKIKATTKRFAKEAGDDPAS